MKNHLIISLLFLSIGFGQNKNDEPNPMKGVKTQIESIYEFEEKFGEFNDIFKGETISRYDPNGNKVESSWYDSDGNLTEGDWGYSKSISKYDTNGNEVEESNYDSDGDLTNNYIGISKTISRYDSNGNKVEWTYYHSDGSLRYKYISKYDSKNRIVELIKYNFGLKFGQLQQTLTEKYIYEYEEY